VDVGFRRFQEACDLTSTSLLNNVSCFCTRVAWNDPSRHRCTLQETCLSRPAPCSPEH
jgi:hypothetical protein